MIIADYNPREKQVKLSDQFGNFTTENTIKAVSKDEAARIVYFKNRTHFYNTMRNWLVQRAHALQSPEKQKLVSTLRSELEKKRGAFYPLVSFICQNAIVFKSIAPMDYSSHYKHYSREILPILNDCISLAN